MNESSSSPSRTVQPPAESEGPRGRAAAFVDAFFQAGRFLLPLPPQAVLDEASARRAGCWFVVWGLLTGIAYATVFSASWRLFGEYHRMRLVPTALLLAADLAFFGHRLVVAAGALAGRRQDARDAAGGVAGTVLAILLIVLLKQALLLSLPYGARPQPADWRQYFGILYPAPIYRPLILMPVWGRWAMMLAAAMGRPSPAAPPAAVRIAAGMNLRAVGANWAAAALLTLWFIPAPQDYLGHGILVTVGVLVAAYFAAFFLGRRERGQTDQTILAAGMAGELSFLLIYLPIASAIYLY